MIDLPIGEADCFSAGDICNLPRNVMDDFVVDAVVGFGENVVDGFGVDVVLICDFCNDTTSGLLSVAWINDLPTGNLFWFATGCVDLSGVANGWSEKRIVDGFRIDVTKGCVFNSCPRLLPFGPEDAFVL